MRVLICGDRAWGMPKREGDVIVLPHNGFNYSKLMYKAMKRLSPEDHVIEGEAAGADVMARIICSLRDIPTTPIPADWCDFKTPCQKQHTHHGMKAGMLRNKEMMDRQPDEVWAFHDDLSKSKGTISTVRMAWNQGIPVLWFSPNLPYGHPIKQGDDLAGLAQYKQKPLGEDI